MEPLRRAVRDRADLFGATCPALAAVRLHAAERGVGAIARMPAAEWTLAGCRGWGCGRELLGERYGGEHADDSWGCSSELRYVAGRSGSVPAIGGFVGYPFEVL